ncbi:hypothetical protein MgSA37_03381 [Mucilaginibacter gotjawali]|uniref:Uncharacterized protein n=2 Tax=Mucilaginibacter gotjawali TaxID=1550579 RepID=A0A839SJD5_9SPHI|nr:hypothetical protein [Mucilaginibacter gotjawali]BAU55200.1 hypothetical protein MgSA37_03381 [Mucilaginibacter gotjawali]
MKFCFDISVKNTQLLILLVGNLFPGTFPEK